MLTFDGKPGGDVRHTNRKPAEGTEIEQIYKFAELFIKSHQSKTRRGY